MIINQENIYEISQTGYNIAGVSYDSVDVLDKFSEGHFAYGAPHPAIVIIDNDQVVQSVLREDGYKNRVTIDQIINAVQ